MPIIARRLALLACAGAAVGAGSARAQDASPVRQMLDCKQVAAAAARLACYDERAGRVAEAIARHELVVADREQVAASRRRLFGFTLPHIPLLDDQPGDGTRGEAKAAPPLDRLETTVRSVGRSGDRWTFVLADGDRWEEVEAGREANEPRAGMPISIRRASLGSYFARIGSGITMRIKRVG